MTPSGPPRSGSSSEDDEQPARAKGPGCFGFFEFLAILVLIVAFSLFLLLTIGGGLAHILSAQSGPQLPSALPSLHSLPSSLASSLASSSPSALPTLPSLVLP